jgi:sporulation protein YqfC
MRSWKHRLQHAATDWLSLPSDALLHVARLTCVDGSEVIIENAVSLLRVSETDVEIDLGDSKVSLHGQAFVISLVSSGEIHVHGVVDQIAYQRMQGGRK